jgi:3,4-dihydroxy 2-butanone 4-phosphate synthase/GTP cyclohydrolase II
MALNSIEEIIEDIRQGKMVILMDDEDRENEGDLIIAAEKVRPEDINFMASKARGLICLTLTGDRCDYLGLPQMVGDNGAQFSTPFTVSIEARDGVTTGISAADRAHTIRVAVDPNSPADAIVQPGHIFPLRARPGGVMSRAGHTEAGCDLARLAGLSPAAAIVEIMNEDGTMARRPDLEEFAKEHDLKIGTIADLIHYRMTNEKAIELIRQETVETDFGPFTLHEFKDSVQNHRHLAMTRGTWTEDDTVPVRVHVLDPMRDILRAGGQRVSWSIDSVMEYISGKDQGVIVLLDMDGQMDVDGSLDKLMGTGSSARAKPQGVSGAYQTIGTGSQILRELGIRKMDVLSSPMKFSALSGFDLEVVNFIEPPIKGE